MLFYLALTTLLLCLAIAVQLTFGLRRVQRLEDWPPAASELPRISIIVPARNEKRHMEAALRSLLRLDYPDLEIVAVDDRSSDGTGAILNQLAAEFPALSVVHVADLPPGWLGKNHALGMGAGRATGQWLLFTDADITMAPDTLRRAIGYAQQNGLDHLTLTPGIVMPSLLLQSFVITFVTFFCIYFQPWKARDPRSKRYIGVGAFNLVRRDAYRQVGTHEVIRMRPDDDMMLGKLLKKHGYRQDSASGIGLISVPWYGSLREVFVGLEKNAFSGVNYSVPTVVAGAAVMLLLDVWPFVAVFVTRGAAQWLYAGTSLVLLAMCWHVAGWVRLPRHSALGFPLCVVLFLVIQWRAMFLTLKNRGIRWRDTHYPLDELKANRV
jgi:glycosyltransferase involved in cell wall biosynthesis